MKKQLFKQSGLSVALLLLASVASSHAASILVNNSSFENPGGGVGVYTSPTSWVNTGGTFTQLHSETTTLGGTALRHGGLSAGATFYQDLGVAFQSFTVYTLTVAVANYNNGNQVESSGLSNFGLRNGATLIGSGQVAGGANTFTDHTYQFTTGAVAPIGNVGILLTSTTVSGVGTRARFDNIRLDATAIPEPSSALLGGLGLLGLVLRRRR